MSKPTRIWAINPLAWICFKDRTNVKLFPQKGLGKIDLTLSKSRLMNKPERLPPQPPPAACLLFGEHRLSTGCSFWNPPQSGLPRFPGLLGWAFLWGHGIPNVEVTWLGVELAPVSSSSRVHETMEQTKNDERCLRTEESLDSNLKGGAWGLLENQTLAMWPGLNSGQLGQGGYPVDRMVLLNGNLRKGTRLAPKADSESLGLSR